MPLTAVNEPSVKNLNKEPPNPALSLYIFESAAFVRMFIHFRDHPLPTGNGMQNAFQILFPIGNDMQNAFQAPLPIGNGMQNAFEIPLPIGNGAKNAFQTPLPTGNGQWPMINGGAEPSAARVPLG